MSTVYKQYLNFIDTNIICITRGWLNWVLSSMIHTPRRHGGEVQNERTHGELLALGEVDQNLLSWSTIGRESSVRSDEIANYLKQQRG